MTNAHTIKIICPANGQEIEIRFEYEYVHHLLIYLPVQFLNIETAVEVLRNPDRIFTTIKRPLSTDSETMCFVGKPDVWYLREGQKVPFPKDEFVFTVYLNARKSIYQFGAEEIDYEDPLSPRDWKNRFGVLIWKKTS